jgi:thermitase
MQNPSMRRLSLSLLLAAVALVVAVASPAAAATDPRIGEQWGLHIVGAPQAWAGGASGGGVTIAVVDTGVDPNHEDLRGKVVLGRNFVGPCRSEDDNGHGTHVAGIAAAIAGNGVGGAGVAPAASVLSVKVLDSEGSGSDVAPAIRYAADSGAQVINLSLGEFAQPLLGPSFSEAIRYAWSKGAVPVVAAGNDFVLGSGFSNEPAMVVSATTRQDAKALYSSGVGAARWGIAAPGDRVLSTWPGNQYDVLSGSSMAAAFVSGAVAALRSLGLSAQESVDRLLATAKDLGPTGRDSTYGAGRLDLAAAVSGTPGGGGTPGGADPGPSPVLEVGDLLTVEGLDPSEGGVEIGVGPVQVSVRSAGARAAEPVKARSHNGAGCSAASGGGTVATPGAAGAALNGGAGDRGGPEGHLEAELDTQRTGSETTSPGAPSERPWLLMLIAAASLVAVASGIVRAGIGLLGASPNGR